MNKVNTATAQTFQAISIGQIILDDSNYLTFWGHLQKGDGWHRCDFVTSYEVLNTMLRHVKDRSDAVQMTIVQKLENMRQIPEMIDLEAELGSAIVFDNMNFRLTRPGYREEGNWVEYTKGECYFIEDASPLTPQKTKQYVKKIDHCMDVLYQSYALYLGYMELDFEEDAARQKADLTDDLKYTLAYYAWKERTI
jgi:MoaA/NifB/PqqE/SkfB family radical SAM enzyme